MAIPVHEPVLQANQAQQKYREKHVGGDRLFEAQRRA